MKLQNRIDILQKLRQYLETKNEEFDLIVEKANSENSWFTPEFIHLSIQNICTEFLGEEALQQWATHYKVVDNINQKKIGIVMAGNIPLVGFHDFLCAFISGFPQKIKLSSKDSVLLKHFVSKLVEWDESCKNFVEFADMLKDCDAYIATGSNNTGRYFEQYFGKYPNIIRRNRTSIALLTGIETTEELEKLSDDIHIYFGLGCRNVTKLYVPKNYDFVPLIKAFDKYKYFSDHNKYKNNYDYQLSLALLNNIYYMTNGTTLLIENNLPFSPISQVNYEYYDTNIDEKALKNIEDLQCIVGKKYTKFGMAQQPSLYDYADGIDVMEFLRKLKN